VDQQLIASSRLLLNRAGGSLRLERTLLPGPHEFRVALYRQDQTLQIEKQGLADLEPGLSNQLTVRVVRRSKMLVKHNADMDILWPDGSPNSAPKSTAPDTRATKGSSSLVATSGPSSR